MTSKPDTTTAYLQLRQAGFPLSTPTNTLLPSPSLLAPTFPSLFALAESERLKGVPERKPPLGLFDALVGDPRALYYELMEDPSRFEEEVATLVQQIVSGQRPYASLSSSERTTLDRATLDWARTRHQKSTTSPTSSKQLAPVKSEAVEYLTRAEILADPTIELEYSEDGQHVPLIPGHEPAPDIPKAPTHWWRKT